VRPLHASALALSSLLRERPLGIVASLGRSR